MRLIPSWRNSSPLRGLFALSLLIAATSANANERYVGHAYATDTKTLAYRETHWIYQDNGVKTRLVTYACADGAPFARKVVRYRDNAAAPDFDFIDARDGYREGVRSESGHRVVFVQTNSGAQMQEKTLDVGADAVIDAGFDAMIRARWDTLAKGGTLSGAFLIPSRFDFLHVKISNVSGDHAQDGLLKMRLEIDAWYGFALPKMLITYRAEDRWLAQFDGISNIRDAALKRSSMRIEYPQSEYTTSVAQSEIDAALTAKLKSACGNG